MVLTVKRGDVIVFRKEYNNIEMPEAFDGEKYTEIVLLCSHDIDSFFEQEYYINKCRISDCSSFVLLDVRTGRKVVGLIEENSYEKINWIALGTDF